MILQEGDVGGVAVRSRSARNLPRRSPVASNTPTFAVDDGLGDGVKSIGLQPGAYTRRRRGRER